MNADPRRYSLLPRLSVGRPVTILMLALALLLLGAVAFFKLPVQMFPAGYDPAFMMVNVPYPGANPSETEEEIVRPLEDAFYTVRGVKEVNCRASSDSGRCWVEFEPYVDMEETYNVVADRIERLRATTWPDDVERVRIRRFSPNSQASMNIALALPGGLEDPYWLLTNRIVNRLERVDGVAQVDLEGVQEKQIFIEPDRDALSSYRISLWELVKSLRSANFALSSGDLRDGGKKLLVRSVARFEDLEEIENLPVREDGLRLGELARVRYAHPERSRGSRLDGADSAIIEVFKESEANTVGVTKAVRAELEKIFEEETQLASGGGFHVLADQGETIEESIRQLRDTGLAGAFFAIVILYFFLRRVRVTLLITAAIPISLLACLVVMFFAGATINLITMMGLIICTGMLVDNAVVVTENIDRFRRSGMPVREAALAGASEISLALTMATVTTVAVFLPMTLMSSAGMMRFMLGKLALPVVVSIVASLFVALLFIPLASAMILRSESESREKVRGPLTRAMDWIYGRIMDPLQRLYELMLRVTLRWRGATLVIVLATVALTYFPFQGVEVEIVQRGHRRGGRQAGFWFNLPNSYGLDDADAWFRRVEQNFEEARAEIGIKHIQTRFWRNRGMVRVMLEDTDKSDITVEQAISALREHVPEAPGVTMYVNWERGTGDASLNVTLYGEDTPSLALLAEEAERRLRPLPDLISVEPELENALEEVRVRVNRNQALQYGITPERISGTISSALRGQRLPRFREAEKEIEIRVRFPEADRQGIGRLAAMPLRTAAGKQVPLEAVADLSVTRGYGDIQRKNRRTSIGIKLNTTRSSVRELRADVSAVMDGMTLPRGYSWDFGQNQRWARQNNTNIRFGLILSMIFIYLIMGFLFESPLLPLSVMPSIVLSWIGVYWLLWLTSSKLDMMAAIGLILLAGVVVNNGIVLVDLINRLRNEGYERLDAILEAGRLRFRPILMTALTTIMGMLPMALGKANFVGMPYSGLGRTFVGGLFSSTSLTLIVVPLFYTIFDDISASIMLLVRGRTRRARSIP